MTTPLAFQTQTITDNTFIVTDSCVLIAQVLWLNCKVLTRTTHFQKKREKKFHTEEKRKKK